MLYEQLDGQLRLAQMDPLQGAAVFRSQTRWALCRLPRVLYPLGNHRRFEYWQSAHRTVLATARAVLKRQNKKD